MKHFLFWKGVFSVAFAVNVSFGGFASTGFYPPIGKEIEEPTPSPPSLPAMFVNLDNHLRSGL